MKKMINYYWVILISLLFAFSCGGDDDNGETPPPPPVEEFPNLLKGGSMEASDLSTSETNADSTTKWTITRSHERMAYIEFGHTSNLPTGGSGGGMAVVDTSAERYIEGSVVWQRIALEANKSYKFSALIKKASQQNAPGAGDADEISSKSFRFWYEFYVTPADSIGTDDKLSLRYKPVPGNEYDFSHGPHFIAGIDYWSCDGGTYNGEFNELADPCKPAGVADEKGIFSVPTTGDYYFVMRIGKYWGHWGDGGFILDNLSLVEVAD